MIVLAIALAVALAAALARRRWIAVTVCGQSMAPTLRDGQRLIARRLRDSPVRRGDVVVFLPVNRLVDDDVAYRVKRVAALAGDPTPAWLGSNVPRVPSAHVVVAGDNPHSQDSRQLGFIAEHTIIARIHARACNEPGSLTSTPRKETTHASNHS